jgi:hypothetical protein
MDLEPSVVFRIPLFGPSGLDNTISGQDRSLSLSDRLEGIGIIIERCNLNERRKPES